MPRNGSGQYSAPTNSWNLAVNGTLATAGDWQAILDDLASALTQSVSRDGQTPMTGNLALGNNKITGLSQGTGTGQALAFEQLFSQGVMADLASAATTDIGAQNTNFLRITGNTTITSFGSNYKGPRFLVFEGSVTLTNSSTLVLPGNANITTAAGDVLIAIPGATLGTADKWIVAAYQAATGYLKSNNPSYTGTLTGGTGVVNLGSGQFYKDSSGNVGIGTSSPTARVSIEKSSDSASPSRTPADYSIRLTAAQTNTYNNGICVSDGTFANAAISPIDTGTSGAQGWAFITGDNSAIAERARIDSSGNLLVGAPSGTGARFEVLAGASDEVASFRRGAGRTVGLNRFLSESGLTVGYIQWSGSTTSYVTSSDYRLKYDIEAMTGALAKVARLKPCTYKWKADGSFSQGFIAHELQEVCPEAVTGEKDAVEIVEVKDAEGNVIGTEERPIYQGIDTSFLAGLYAAALQELIAKNDALEARLSALEAKA